MGWICNMFDLLKARLIHGYQAIPDPLKVKLPDNFPGFPRIFDTESQRWKELQNLCPTQAIGDNAIDLGLCIFCGACQRKHPEAVEFCSFHKLAASTRERLLITSQDTPQSYEASAIIPDKLISKIFGRSFKLRSVSAGGCAACELELNACGNVNFDMGRYGIDIVASPRHADGLIVSGPISANMAFALEETWNAVPEPKLLILAGTCAISGGIFSESPAVERSFLQKVKTSLFIPGCPVHPLTVIHGIAKLLGRC